MKKIVIVGGGAGGLELATTLGKKLGKSKKAQITLVDKNITHLWKPLLHEIATGALNDDLDYVSFLEQAKTNYFHFRQGILADINRDNKTVLLDEIKDASGSVIIPKSELSYDVLVLAIGSTSNDFGTEGVKEHCLFLDDQEAAKRFRKKILSQLFKISSGVDAKDKLNISIVGAGATGVEVATELLHMTKTLGQYGFDKLDSSLLNITLIEATDKILPALPEKTSKSIKATIESMGVKVLTQTRIVKADANHFYPDGQEPIPADVMLWTAGVKAPNFLKDIGGLESARTNQLMVKETLQTTKDDSIFVIGDCACHPKPEGGFTPPTAQAAHQMAILCAKNVTSYVKDKKLKPFVYKNKGTIISLAHTAEGVVSTVGKKQMSVKGYLALKIYHFIYSVHKMALFGVIKTCRLSRASKVFRSIRTKVNLN